MHQQHVSLAVQAASAASLRSDDTKNRDDIPRSAGCQPAALLSITG